MVAAWKAEGAGRLDGLKVEVLAVVVQSEFVRMVQGYQAFVQGSAAGSDRDLIVATVKRVVEPLIKDANGFDPDRLEVNESEVVYR